MRPIPYGRQDINQEDIDHVVSVLKSDWLTQGPAIEQFENIVARYCGAKYAVAVNSATAGLHLGALALGLTESDSLWTSPITFVASSNAAFYCGAKPDFVDIDLTTYNMSMEALEKKLRASAKPKVVVPVHFSGLSCEMKKLRELSEKYGFKIMEDASHAIGSSHDGVKVGACEHSDLCVFSFHPVKIITTGEGGIVTTNNKELYEKIKILRTHGITREAQKLSENDGPWYYEQQHLGFNYRMTDIQAALGLSQMKRLENFVVRRNQLANVYKKEFEGLPLAWQVISDKNLSAYHLFVITLDLSKIKKTHLQIYKELQSHNIGVNLHYIPVYRQPYYKKLNHVPSDFPNAEKYYQTAITLPLFPSMTDEQQKYVIEAVRRVLV